MSREFIAWPLPLYFYERAQNVFGWTETKVFKSERWCISRQELAMSSIVMQKEVSGKVFH